MHVNKNELASAAEFRGDSVRHYSTRSAVSKSDDAPEQEASVFCKHNCGDGVYLLAVRAGVPQRLSWDGATNSPALTADKLWTGSSRRDAFFPRPR